MRINWTIALVLGLALAGCRAGGGSGGPADGTATARAAAADAVPPSTAAGTQAATLTGTPPPEPTRTPAAAPTGTPPPEPTRTPAPTGTATALPAVMCSPLDGYSFQDLTQIVSAPFAAPRPGKDDGHHGTDFAHYVFGDRTTIAGVPVAAVFDGTVAAAIVGSVPYGHFAIVETQREDLPAWFTAAYAVPDGVSVYHLYAHLETPAEYAIGDPVACGEILGTVGNSGWSGNYHLHFEIRFGPAGAAFESMSYYLTTTTEAERANYERWRFGGEFVPIDPMDVIEIAITAGE